MANLDSVSCNPIIYITCLFTEHLQNKMNIHILGKRIYSRCFIRQNKGNLGKRLGNYRIPKMKDLTTNISVR